MFGNRSRATESDGEDTLESIEWNVEQQRENLRDSRGPDRKRCLDLARHSMPGMRRNRGGGEVQASLPQRHLPRPRDYELFRILELERGWILNEESPEHFHVSRCKTERFNIKQVL